jgi:lipid-binding SYLF domain-containing protein
METRRFTAVLGLVFLIGVPACHSGDSQGPKTPAEAEKERAKAAERIDEAATVLAEIGGTSDDQRKIPGAVTQRAECVAVVPGLVEGAFIVGGKSGRGVATCRTPGGWSAPGFFSLGGGTLGAQIGGRSTDVLMLLNSERAKRSFLSGDFRVGGEVSATAGDVGSGKGVDSTSTSLRAEVVSYMRGRGLFAGADLSGAVVSRDVAANHAYYGDARELKVILSQSPAPSAETNRFLEEVTSLFVRPSPQPAPDQPASTQTSAAR